MILNRLLGTLRLLLLLLRFVSLRRMVIGRCWVFTRIRLVFTVLIRVRLMMRRRVVCVRLRIVVL